MELEAKQRVAELKDAVGIVRELLALDSSTDVLMPQILEKLALGLGCDCERRVNYLRFSGIPKIGFNTPSTNE